MATKETLLTSEAFIKGIDSISDNVAGKYILPSIREAQEVGLRRIVGSALLAKLKTLAGEKIADAKKEIPEPYASLLSLVKYYLAYAALVEVTNRVTFKVANAGVVRSEDENLAVADSTDMYRKAAYYQAKADSTCADIQRFCLANRSALPELSEGDCDQIRANLYSAASCGLFLGGPRGKRLPRI